MFTLNAVTLLINSLTLPLALGCLLLLLWQDSKKEQNQFFAVFMFLIVIWNLGSLITQAAEIIAEVSPTLLWIALFILELGFTGTSVAIYMFTTVVAGLQTRRFRILAFLSLSFVIGTRLFLLIAAGGDVNTTTIVDDNQSILAIFYFLFNVPTLYIVWRYRRKVRSIGIVVGIIYVVVGQGLILVNPELIVASFSTSVASIGVFIISISILHQEIILPLSERNLQVEAMHRVSLSITKELSVEVVLNEITFQATAWVNGDGAGIFLKRDGHLELASVYMLPEQWLDARVDLGEGVVGTVAVTHNTVYLENYARDWQLEDSFEIGNQTFGSVIAVPLIYVSEIIGVLLVVSGHQGTLFNADDVHAMELLAAQAAVAIAHGRVFTEQRRLAEQLETVLVSTQNPVIAVDRQFNLVFANSAAKTLLDLEDITLNTNIFTLLPSNVFPDNLRYALRQLYQNKGFVYEITVKSRIYQCHLGVLGRRRIAGWVAVLNDITQLAELDRLKSEMVRMASHDLKNPLMGAMTHLELLQDDLVTNVPKDDPALESIEVIEKQLQRMQRIINGVLDVERLKSGSLLRDQCVPGELIESSVRDLEILIQQNNIILDVNVEVDLPMFAGDCDQFERVLVNLIENAIKFTKYGDNSEVGIFAYSQDHNIIFEVRDNGIGIPEDMHDRIFERFFRGKQKGIEHVSGSGLGLSLVKAIVENHRGRIWLESEPDNGTAFYISIPPIG